MKVVTAGLGDDVDHRARVLSVLGGVVTGLHTEFLQRIRKGEGLVDVGVLVHIVAAVELVTHHVLARAVGRNRDCAGKGLGESLVGAAVGRVDRTWRQQRELGGIAPVQRQLGNAGLFDHLSDGRGHGIDLGRVAFHLDNFASRSHLQLQAHSQSLVGQQGDVLPGIAEPFGLDG